jgi:L-ascorbate metabolism protein UlaG (beta-lactamase superfamily)
VFAGADSGFFPGFAEIGRRLGPFDASILEIGAYGQGWPDIHLGPEQAVAAHLALGGGLLVPAHWATFALAMHGWTEPAERLMVAASGADVRFVLPRPGESIDPRAPQPVERWWPELPWSSAADSPIIAAGSD